MFTKENIKNYIIIISISLLIYKIIDNPRIFISGIGSLARFFSPFLIGILLALLIDPLVKFFENKFNTHRLINILLSYIIISILIFIIFKLLIPATINTLNSIIKEIPKYIDFLNSSLEKKISRQEFFEATLPHFQQNLNSILSRGVNALTDLSTNLIVYIFSITSLIFNIIMGVILSIYMLYDKEKIARGFKRLLYASLNKDRTDKIIEFCKMAHEIFYHYLVGTFIESLIVGIIVFLGFQFIFRIENSFFFAFIIFLTNMIPYFGPFIGAFLPVSMTLIYSPLKAIWISVFIFVVQQLDGNFIGPKVVGNKVGLSPLWIISAVLIGGEMFGLVGLFISIPIAAIMNVLICDYIKKRL
ncbi:AI-2E family transporter [Clostridioides mangenotii]|uniref:AI-2E family transporter n=1 Tax=Metaclostridioides mangenotii TaxID=1540 RepID=UPI001C0FA76E|nr:AI-2E family transporter [Clostridioides mangenotii]MBU5306238.1 AI-2E family transporter [Clostridioides mangenotii]MCR1955627.1 AI-2E family transporter [Clostridioides mangenotii]